MGWDDDDRSRGHLRSRTPSSVLGRHPGIGDVVGGYAIVDRLGAGGMATVYRARNADGREVALKILDPGRVIEEDVKRFAREYKVMSRIDHENVVRVFDSDVHDGYPWLAMELVEGTDLESEIAAWRAAPPTDRYERIDRIMRGLCRGLQYVHDIGMIHRDLKPSNVLLTRGGEPKLSDFGVVKGGNNTANTQLTMAGRLVGTVAFMAPELIVAEGIDRRADLYALGAVLYLMLTFHRPIEAESVAGYLARHLTEVPRPPHELDPAVPPGLERICQRLLQKDPAFRYPSAQAVLHALDRGDQMDALPVRGREEEITAFGRRLVALQQGAGEVVALIGEAGAGKSHLLEALVDQAKASQVHVAAVKATTAGTLAKLLEAAGGEPDGTVNDLKRLARILRGSPWVLAIDDLDGASSGAISALSRLMRQRVGLEGEPLLLVFTATDPEGTVGPLLSGESTGLPCASSTLGPLDAKSVTALLRDRGVLGAAAPALGRRLHEAYGGQPGPIVEQLQALIDAGWFTQERDGLRPQVNVEALRKEELPAPAAVVADLERRLAGLDHASLDLVRYLALLDRPASDGLLTRCATEDPTDAEHVPARLDNLVTHGLLVRSAREGEGGASGPLEMLQFAHPCAAKVVRATLDGHQRRHLHAQIARALRARRRRANALEIAHHRRLSGDLDGAYPLYVQAARRSARDGHWAEVLDVVAEARRLQPTAERSLDPEERARMARWLHQLEGEAHIARGAWDAAIQPLEAAIREGRVEDDDQALARCLAGLGRARYRRGEYAEAEPLLREALHRAEPTAPERAAALRALADIEIRAGRLDEARTLCNEALTDAIDHSRRDAEARARRGLAHLGTLEGRWEEAASLLAQADDLLAQDGDPRVRSGVMLTLVDLDTAAGRFGSALWRAEALVELCRRREITERLPDAYALLADLLHVLDDPDAVDAAQQALVFAKAHGGGSWFARVRAARVLHLRGGEAASVLPGPEDLPADPIADPAAQLAALRAHVAARSDPRRALDLAAWAHQRPPPRLALHAGRIALDCAAAFTTLQQVEAARTAVKRGLRLLSGAGTDALRIELLVALHTARPDERVLEALRQVLPRVVANLSSHALRTYTARPVIRDVA